MISLKTDNWNLNNIETVLLDKDGTFIDLHYFWGKMTELRAEEVIKRFNLDNACSDDLCLFLGYDTKTCKMLKDGITALYSRPKIIEIFKNDLTKYNVNTTDTVLAEIFDYVSEKFYKNMQEYTKPINSAINFIKELKKHNVKIGIVTSDSVDSTRLTLEHFQWNALFDTYAGRESSPESKESGALTKIALQNLNANPETTIMIGDAPMDYLAAKNAGVENTILVSTGQIDSETLRSTSPFVVDSLDIIQICEQSLV